jgi:adenine-specific DNA-methyltransferase
MQNLFQELQELLQQTPEFFTEDGILLRNLLIEKALRLDRDLIELLLTNEQIKAHFFVELSNTIVFDKEKFLQFVNNKQFLPDSYTAFKNKIGLSDNGGRTLLSQGRDVVLVWPYKDCVLEGGQTKEEAKRDEIFWNATLAPDDIHRLLDPKVLTNWRRFDKKGELFPTKLKGTDNLIVRGNNLLALHSLEPCYAEKVKLIYVDLPFNIDSDDFGYNDSFNHSTWLTFIKNRMQVARRLLRKDGSIFVHIDHHELGYVLVLMDEIFGQDNFVQLITVKSSSPAGFKTVNPGPIDVTEFILFYTKEKSSFRFKKGYVPAEYDENYNLFLINPEDSPAEWKFKSLRDVIYERNEIEVGETYQQSNKNAERIWGPNWKIIRDQLVADFALQNADRVVSVRDPHKPVQVLKELLKKSKKTKDQIFIYHQNGSSEEKNANCTYILNGGALSFYSNKVKYINGELTNTILLTDLWTDISWDGIANEGNVTLKNGKKPERLIQRLIEIATDNVDDIVLDFFLGSGTTAAVAHKMGRQYIGIEQLDYGKNSEVVRLQNVINGDQTGISKYVDWQGGGSFIYCELMQWNEVFVQRIQEAKEKSTLIQIWNDLQDNAFLSYDVNISEINENIEVFEDLSIDEQKRFLFEVLDKNALYVNLSEMDDVDYEVSDEDKRLNRLFYGLEG